MSRRPDPVLRTALRDHLVAQVDATRVHKRVSAQRERRRAAWVTAAVAVIVITASVLLLRSGPLHRPAPAASLTPSTSSEIRAALRAVLPRLPGATPASTWTEASPTATGDMVDLTGKALLIAGACTGGGAVTIDISGRDPIRIDCTSTGTIGPIQLTDPDQPGRPGDDSGTFSIDVAAISGTPHYLVQTTTIAPVQITQILPTASPTDEG